MILDRATVDAILRRSEDGEGVAAILTSMGIDEQEGIDYLAKHHHDELRAVKQIQIARNKVKQAVAPETPKRAKKASKNVRKKARKK